MTTSPHSKSKLGMIRRGRLTTTTVRAMLHFMEPDITHGGRAALRIRILLWVVLCRHSQAPPPPILRRSRRREPQQLRRSRRAGKPRPTTLTITLSMTLTATLTGKGKDQPCSKESPALCWY